MTYAEPPSDLKGRIWEISSEDLTKGLRLALQSFETGEYQRGELNERYWMSRSYFMGAALCLDIAHNYSSDADVITISHDRESWGFFTGGTRRLLNIEQLKLLEETMEVAEIHYTAKWNEHLIYRQMYNLF